MDMLKTHQSLLETYINQWQLEPDGPAFCTHSSALQPVLTVGKKAMLKIPFEKEEIRCLPILEWWNQHGTGAVKVFRSDHQAILMDRLRNNPPGLLGFVMEGNDDRATAVICKVIASLHACSASAASMPTGIVPLEPWFKGLFQVAGQHGILIESAKTAAALLAEQKDPVLLHGDMHHENVLQSTDGKWLAIDPHGLYGERGFDYANIFCNPENAPSVAIQQLPDRLNIVARESGIHKQRLLQWILAYSGLSASWFIMDGIEDVFPLKIAEIAHQMLQHS